MLLVLLFFQSVTSIEFDEMPLGYIFSCLFTVTFSNLMFALISKNVLSSNNAVNIVFLLARLWDFKLCHLVLYLHVGRRWANMTLGTQNNTLRQSWIASFFFKKRRGLFYVLRLNATWSLCPCHEFCKQLPVTDCVHYRTTVLYILRILLVQAKI